MKFAAVLLLAFVAAVASGPVSISDNNVGDIVTVGVNANLELSNKVEQNIISVIVALLNQQAIALGQADAAPADGYAPKIKITPEMIENVKALLAKH